MICWFSKFVISVPLPDATCETISRAVLEELVLKFGTPNQIVSDNASSFTSAAFQQFCSLLEIGHHRAIPHHSKGNGATERTFRTFHAVISKYINKEHSDWDTILPFTTFSYNNTVHSTTGETPFFLVFGRDPTLTIDRIIDPAPATKKTDIGWFKESLTTTLREVWKEAATQSKEAQATYQKKANEGAKGSDIRPGDRVMYKNYSTHKGLSRKLVLPWKGDFRVVEVNPPRATIYDRQNPRKPEKVVHLDQIKKIYGAEDGKQDKENEEGDEHAEENQEESERSEIVETDTRTTSDVAQNNTITEEKAEESKKGRKTSGNRLVNGPPIKGTTPTLIDTRVTEPGRRNPKREIKIPVRKRKKSMSNKEETHNSTKDVPNGEKGMVEQTTGAEEDVVMEDVMEEHEPAGLAALGSGLRSRTAAGTAGSLDDQEEPIVNLDPKLINETLSVSDTMNPLLYEAQLLEEGEEEATPIDEALERELLEVAAPGVQEVGTSQFESAENHGEPFPVFEKNHPMARWYGGFGDEELPREPAKRAVSLITLDDVQNGRNMTVAAITEDQHVESRPHREVCQATINFAEVIDEEKKGVIVASVVRSLGKTWVLSPTKREYCGQDRGDLYYLLLNENAVDDTTGKHLEPAGLFLGDVIIVTSVYRRPQFKPSDWSSRVLAIDEAKNAFFAVKTFTVLARTIEESQPVVPTNYRRGNKYALVAYGTTRLVFGKMLEVKKQGKGWYAADIMMPATQPAQLLRYVRKGESHQQVIKATEAVQGRETIFPQIVRFAAIRPKEARCLTSAPMTFANVHSSEDFPSYAQAYAASLGIYGIVAVSTRNEESRHFVAKLVRMERGRANRLTCELDLEMAEQTTHPNLWPKGTSIQLERSNGDGLRAVVSAGGIRQRTMFLRIRLLTPTTDLAISERLVIKQTNVERADWARQAPRLRDIPEVTSENHAMKALSVLSGSGVLPPLGKMDAAQALEIEGFRLYKQQEQIVRWLSTNRFVAMAIDCAFGTGKTSTLVLAVLNRKNVIRGTSMMVGVSNSSVTAAVSAIEKFDKSRSCRFVRMISEDNRTRVVPEHLTDYDFPCIWRSHFKKLVKELDAGSSRLNNDIVDAAIYLRQAGEMTIKSLRRGDLRNAVANRKTEQSRMSLFFKLFRPHFVLGTVSSIRTGYAHDGMSKFVEDVGLVLVDEASQIPRCAVITLCHSFPSARLAFFGDRRQLPPFSDNCLPDKLHSNLFYDGKLQTNKKPGQDLPALRSMGLPDCHPVVVINHNFPHVIDGTSVLNQEEAQLALYYAKGLRKIRPDDSICILAFYKSTCTYIEENAPVKVRCSTVDGVQGREYDYTIVLTSRTSGAQTFLDDKKRINVAISRTKTACIIMGNVPYLRSAHTTKELIAQVSVLIFNTSAFEDEFFQKGGRCETLRHSLHHISLNLNHTNSSIVAMPTLSSSPFLSLRRPHAEAVLFPFTTSTFTAPVNYTVADRGRGDSLFV
uniref:Integrase catalytic domain-containing protein n=2 Tax=Caenorhabditis japonica TaxID=281687 RepID=A0A8R1HT47_CAEJA